MTTTATIAAKTTKNGKGRKASTKTIVVPTAPATEPTPAQPTDIIALLEETVKSVESRKKAAEEKSQEADRLRLALKYLAGSGKYLTAAETAARDAAKARLTELESSEEVVILRDERVRQESRKVFQWVNSTAKPVVAVVTDWAGKGLAAGAIRVKKTEAASGATEIRVIGTFGRSSAKVGETFTTFHSVPRDLRNAFVRTGLITDPRSAAKPSGNGVSTGAQGDKAS